MTTSISQSLGFRRLDKVVFLNHLTFDNYSRHWLGVRLGLTSSTLNVQTIHGNMVIVFVTVDVVLFIECSFTR